MEISGAPLKRGLLSPVDLAVSKIARLGDNDIEDIQALVRLGLTTPASIKERAEAALIGYIFEQAEIRQSIKTAVAKTYEALKPQS